MTLHSQLPIGIELPNLIITGQNNLTKLVYDSSTHLYRISVHTNFANKYKNSSRYHVKTLTLNNLVFVAIYNKLGYNNRVNKGKIIKFTNTLQQITEKEFDSGFASFATDGTRIFISTEGKLVSLNQDLEPEPSAENQSESEEVSERKRKNRGKLIADAICAPADITYSTDLKILNQAREQTENIIDTLHKSRTNKSEKKPRTYQKTAHKDYLEVAKQRRPSRKIRRKAIKKQLQLELVALR